MEYLKNVILTRMRKNFRIFGSWIIWFPTSKLQKSYQVQNSKLLKYYKELVEMKMIVIPDL